MSKKKIIKLINIIRILLLITGFTIIIPSAFITLSFYVSGILDKELEYLLMNLLLLGTALMIIYFILTSIYFILTSIFDRMTMDVLLSEREGEYDKEHELETISFKKDKMILKYSKKNKHPALELEKENPEFYKKHFFLMLILVSYSISQSIVFSLIFREEMYFLTGFMVSMLCLFGSSLNFLINAIRKYKKKQKKEGD